VEASSLPEEGDHGGRLAGLTLKSVDYGELESRTVVALANQNRDIYTIEEKDRTFLPGRARGVLHVNRLEFPRAAFVLGEVSNRSDAPDPKRLRDEEVDRIMMGFLSSFGMQMPPFRVRRVDTRPGNCVGDAEWEEGRPKLPEARDEGLRDTGAPSSGGEGDEDATGVRGDVNAADPTGGREER
jgi:hypothetical protein